ncbi:MAG: gephyrin-like molybdotransferase Glp [bacterium]
MSLLPIDEALALIAASAPLLEIEDVPPADALGRTLAAPVVAAGDLPPFDNSAVDGYAICSADFAQPDAEIGAALRVRGAVTAGGAAAPPLAPGETVRVMTGGRVPDGADAVVMREEVTETDGVAVFWSGAPAGANIRRRGLEIRAGELACDAGTLVNPGALGLLVSLGVARVSVRRRPRVAILATGDELLEPSAAPRHGHIYDSSTPILSALVASAGAIPVPLPLARDDRDELAQRFRDGLEHDVFVTTGGVSVGDHDFTKEILAQLGVTIRFWKVAMKPGKPLVYGERGATRVFGLPGNPGSSLATFERFVRPALRKMVGDPAWAPREADAILDAPCDAPGNRAWFLRAHATIRDGALHALPLAAQGSGTLRSLADCNAFIILSAGSPPRVAGARVRVQLLPEIYGVLSGG